MILKQDKLIMTIYLQVPSLGWKTNGLVNSPRSTNCIGAWIILKYSSKLLRWWSKIRLIPVYIETEVAKINADSDKRWE
jgi:hypothetical protein